MHITFPGPDGTPITVADTRRDPVPNKPTSKNHTAILPEARRPSAWIVGTMKV